MHAVAGVRLADEAAGAGHGLDDRNPERRGEIPVALVLAGHGHDRAGAVGAQHVVGEVDRDGLAGERVPGVGPGEAPTCGRVALGGEPVDLRAAAHRRDERLDLSSTVVGGDLRHEGVFGGEHAEGHAEAGVGTGGEDPEGRAAGDRLAGRIDDRHRELGALGASDPVALLGEHALGPLEAVEVIEELLGVVGDAEVPLLEVATFDGVVGTFAAAVDDLFVGEHRLTARAPVDRRVLAVDQIRPRGIAGRSTGSNGCRRGCGWSPRDASRRRRRCG